MTPYTCTSGLSQTEPAFIMAEWLNTMPWDYYCTLTTRYAMTVKSARRAMDRLYSYLYKMRMGANIFWVAEPFDLKEGYHLHALVRFHKRNGKKKLINAWNTIAKNGYDGKQDSYSVIRDYEADKGAHYYVTKYMLKRYADYDIFYN